MKLKNLLISSLIVMISGFLVIAFLTIKLNQAQQDLDHAYSQRYISYLLADELRQSSDDLTRLARTYVITGDEKYEKMYFEILDIRNGVKPRPTSYNRIYWDLVLQYGNKPRIDGETQSLKSLMKDAGFTEQEFAQLSKAQANSDGLVKTETIAMNMVKGLYDDGRGQFDIKGDPDFAKAREMMHDNQYHQYKANIMVPILEFQRLLDERTQLTVNNAMQQVEIYTILEIIAFFLLLVSLVIAARVAYKLYKRMTKLVVTVRSISDTCDFSIRANSAGTDELADIGRAMNQLITVMQDAVTEANQVMNAVASATFSQRMQNNYVGELATLKQGVNGSAQSVSFMMNELEKVMQHLIEGQFNVRMDQRVPAQFRQKIENSFNQVHAVVTDINRIMESLNMGDFDARITSKAQGELSLLKNSINNSLDFLDEFVSGLVHLAQEQAKGDLTASLTGNFHGRYKQLQDTRAEMAIKIAEVIDKTIQASIVVNNASAQVSRGATELSARVQEQAAALEETSATMQQMSSAVQSSTANARQVADLAHHVQQQSVDGGKVMQETIAAMQSIRDSSHKIADIVSIIDGIAFQTNLLALNAAVEAARAGEHGRGFAVVASEVRALAGKSAEAAKDIKVLIDDSVTRVDRGTGLAEKSGNMLTSITQSVEQVAGMIEAIAAAANEQSAGISQVHKAIADIDAVTQQNAALVEETTAAAESLNQEANELRQNMAFFKTGQNNMMPTATRAATNRSIPKSSKPATKALPAPSKTEQATEWQEF